MSSKGSRNPWRPNGPSACRALPASVNPLGAYRSLCSNGFTAGMGGGRASSCCNPIPAELFGRCVVQRHMLLLLKEQYPNET